MQKKDVWNVLSKSSVNKGFSALSMNNIHN